MVRRSAGVSNSQPALEAAGSAAESNSTDVLSPASPSAEFTRTVQAFAHTSDSPTGASNGETTTLRRKRSSAETEHLDSSSAPSRKRSTRSSSRAEGNAEESPSKKEKSGISASSTVSSQRSKTTNTASTTARKLPPAPGNPRGVVSKLQDALGENLLVMFVGVNPGIATAETGHAYAHASNLFWKLLYESGLTPRKCLPSETHDLVPWLRYGNTNLVARPTKDASTLSKAELDAGVADIEAKAVQCRAQVVCLVGKGIWEAVDRVWKKRGHKVAGFKYGWRPEGERLGKGMGATKGGSGAGFFKKASKKEDGEAGADYPGARVFVATTTSGLAAGMSWDEKLAVWRELGEWVAQRRREEEGEEKATDGG